jgi:HAD superfamily hydrolase (TIGR01509 family)
MLVPMLIGIMALVLDMDGLLVDSEGCYRDAWQSAARSLGFHLGDDVYVDLVGRGNAEGEALVALHFGPAFPVGRFRRLWRACWSDLVSSRGIPAKPGALDLLKHLAERQIPIALATSSEQDRAIFTLRAAGIDATVFRCIVTGDQVERSKPSPDIYLRAAQALELAPQQCLAVEDSDAGILAATSTGMPAIQVPDLKAPAPPIPPGVQVVESLFDVLVMLRECQFDLAPTT